jgi:gas vesicle protein
MSDHRTDSLLAFLLGATVGAGVALLLAPQSGEETRKKIAEKSRRLGDELDHKLQGVKEEVKARSGDIKQAVVAGKDAFDRARHSGEPAPTSTAM